MSDFFKGITFPWQSVTPSDDAIVRRSILPDRFLSGCEISYSGYTLSMDAGVAIVCGRQFRHTAYQSWPIVEETSGYARLLLTIDSSKASTEDAFEQIYTSIEYASAVDGFLELRQEDINNSGTLYQVVLCIVALGTNGITAITEQFIRSDNVFYPGRPVSMGGHKIANLESPTEDSDAAPKSYVDDRMLIAEDPNGDGNIVLRYGAVVNPENGEGGGSGTGTGGGTGGGKDGEDGGYYFPTVDNGVLSWTASKSNMPTVPSAKITPEKGVDYFTDEDKAEIVEAVKSMEYPVITYEYADGGYWNKDNEWTTDPTYWGARTNMISVTPGDKLSYQGYGMYNVPSVIWFNADQNILSYENDNAVAKAVVKSAPDNAAYARFCAFSSEGAVNTFVVEWVWCQAVDEPETPSSPLHGKKIAYDGDSICYGAGYRGGYAKLIAEKVGGTYDNQAVGGARLVTKGSNSWHSVVDNLPDLPMDADLYCFNGGINDYWTPSTLGTYDYTSFNGELDTTTVCGALETIFRYCLNKFVGKPVCFVITHKIQNTAYKDNANGDSFKDYHDAMVGICEKYSIPYYDAFSESGLNGWNSKQSKAFLTGSADGTPDGCHPNEEGYKRYYVPQLVQLFERIMPEDVTAVEIGEDYTNQLPLATDIDGVTVYNGVGYKANTRWSSSSQADTTGDGVYFSGHIPVATGDIVYLKNVTIAQGDTSNAGKVLFVTTLGSVATSLNGSTLDDNASPVWTDGVLTQFTVPSGGYKYIRLQAAYIGADSIVTVNEEIE